MGAPPPLDLVLSTIGRTAEPERLFRSLARQSFSGFRLIAVDQNADRRLDPLVARFASKFPILHLRSSERGLSRGRNAGLAHVNAAIVAFPDDDCWYPPDFLARLADVFSAHPEWDGVAGSTIEEDGSRSGLLWKKGPGVVTRHNVLRCMIAPAIFLRRGVVETVGPFDPMLGVGAGTPWGSGEETDYVLRAIETGFRIAYEPALAVGHPAPRPRPGDRAALVKAHAYGVGHSEVLRRHGYPSRYIAWRALQLIVGAPVFVLSGDLTRTRFYWAMARGRLEGLRRVSVPDGT